MKKYARLYVPIYKETIHLFCTDSMEFVTDKFPGLEEHLCDDFNGFSCYNDEGIFVLILNSDKAHDSTISHEVFHITCRILQHCGIPFTDDTEEAYAYLNGFISADIRAQLHEWGLEIRYEEKEAHEN